MLGPRAWAMWVLLSSTPRPTTGTAMATSQAVRCGRKQKRTLAEVAVSSGSECHDRNTINNLGRASPPSCCHTLAPDSIRTSVGLRVEYAGHLLLYYTCCSNSGS